MIARWMESARLPTARLEVRVRCGGPQEVPGEVEARKVRSLRFQLQRPVDERVEGCERSEDLLAVQHHTITR